MRDDTIAVLAEGARTMAELELVTAYGHLSCRTDTGMLITPARALAGLLPDDLVEVPWSTERLPEGCPAEAWAHLALYRTRSDVMSIARAQPRAALAVGAVTEFLPPFFGQMAWLSESIPVHTPAVLLRTPHLAAEMAAQFVGGDAMLLRGNGAITTGDSPGAAVARMWLLENACEAWLRASAVASPTPLSDAEIASWRNVRQELLPRLWEYLRVGG